MNDLAMLMFGLSGGGSIKAESYSEYITKNEAYGNSGADNFTGYVLNCNGYNFYMINWGMIRLNLENPTLDSDGMLEVAETKTNLGGDFGGFLPCVYRTDGIYHTGMLYFYFNRVNLIPSTELPQGKSTIQIRFSGAIYGKSTE
jgi:hypothetical protein